VSPLFYLLVGLPIGMIIGWLARALRQPPLPDSRLESELRQLLSQRDADLNQVRSQLLEAANHRAEAEAKLESAEQRIIEQRGAHERAAQEARLAQDKAIADLKQAFRALSADALERAAPEFLRLAQENFGKFQETAKGDLAQRQEAIKTLVEPLKQQLETYQKRLQQSESAQTATLGEVRQQLETLSQHNQALAHETQQFRTVLNSNQARGRWGEETLRRVVEAAGMSPHCDFTEQTREGDGKPDLVVRLPGDRVIIVDSKVPDLDFLNALELADPAKRADSLLTHANKLKAMIKTLAERDYPSQFPLALDHVVLFLPAESLFSAALEGDRDLIVWAASRHILLATPASLIALLRSVSVCWQQYAQTENAQKIAEAARELYSRVVKFIEYFERVGEGLKRANSAFNDAAGSFQMRVRPAGERLVDLGGGVAGKELPYLETLENGFRLIADESPRENSRAVTVPPL
jgi:DNA recombination protein RmuC